MIRRPLFLAALCLAPNALQAQGDCFPAKDSHEAQTFGILSVPLAFTGARAPGSPRGVTFGVEVANLPTVDRETARPTTCRPGKGPENTDPIPVVVRPRVTLAAGGFLFEASWIPPVRVQDVKANLVGVAIAHPFALASGWYLGVRAHAVLGALHAPITCDDDALRDATSECFNGTRSDDRWRPGVYGVEAVVGGGRGRIKPHAGVGYTHLAPRFQVHFTNAAGDTDTRRVEVDLDRAALFGGLTVPLGAMRLTGEAYATLGDAVVGRVVLRVPVVR